MWAGIVGDSLVDPHILLHRLTDKHYRDILLHDLPKLLAVRTRMWHVHDGAPAAELCEMCSITPTMTEGQVEEDPLHGLHARQICTLWILIWGGHLKSLCMQLLLTKKNHFTIALWMPLNYPSIFERMRWSTTRRVAACSESHGGQFEHLV
jgi:hypothetical protein